MRPSEAAGVEGPGALGGVRVAGRISPGGCASISRPTCSSYSVASTCLPPNTGTCVLCLNPGDAVCMAGVWCVVLAAFKLGGKTVLPLALLGGHTGNLAAVLGGSHRGDRVERACAGVPTAARPVSQTPRHPGVKSSP